jgi:membrane associated rhomboid family serine protease
LFECHRDSNQHDTVRLIENQPKSPNQWWRYFSSLVIHAGVIQLFLVLFVQYTIGIEIERTAGWLRVMCIYIGSHIGGTVVSGVLAPYEVTAGADAAVFGLLAVTFVDVSRYSILVYFLVCQALS